MEWIKRIWGNIQKRGVKDITNPKRISAFMKAEYIKKNGIHLKYEEIVPYAEQLVYRTVSCQTCVSKGKCEHCTCEIPSALMVKEYTCSGDNFYEMKSPEEWNKFKELTGLQFKIASTK